MAQRHQRVFALTLALLFLGTSVATGALVVWQIRKDNQASKTAQEDADTTQQALDEIGQTNQQGENMLKGTNLADFAPTGEVDKLQIIDIKEGTGAEVKATDTVTAHYTGAFGANGLIFESSKDGGTPATFPLAQVIKGWQEGVPGMKVGGIRRLVIPGELAYGAAPAGYTPNLNGQPQGTLVFDIEMVSVGE